MKVVSGAVQDIHDIVLHGLTAFHNTVLIFVSWQDFNDLSWLAVQTTGIQT